MNSGKAGEEMHKIRRGKKKIKTPEQKKLGL